MTESNKKRVIKNNSIGIFFHNLQLFQNRRMIEYGQEKQNYLVQKKLKTERTRHKASQKKKISKKASPMDTSYYQARSKKQENLSSQNLSIESSPNTSQTHPAFKRPASNQSNNAKTSATLDEQDGKKSPQNSTESNKHKIKQIVDLASNDDPLKAILFKIQNFFSNNFNNNDNNQNKRAFDDGSKNDIHTFSNNSSQRLHHDIKQRNQEKKSPQVMHNTESSLPTASQVAFGFNQLQYNHENKSNPQSNEKIQNITKIVSKDDPLKAIFLNIKRFFDQFAQDDSNTENTNHRNNESVTDMKTSVEKNSCNRMNKMQAQHSSMNKITSNHNEMGNIRNFASKIMKDMADPSKPKFENTKNNFDLSNTDITKENGLSSCDIERVQKSKAKSEARRRRILDSKKERMGMVLSGEVKVLVKEAEASNTTIAGSAKLQQMRRRRFKKSSQKDIKPKPVISLKVNDDEIKNKLNALLVPAAPRNIPKPAQDMGNDLNIKTQIELKEECKKDSQLSKYVRMVSVGVPLSSVLHKMKQDAIPHSKLISFEKAFDSKQILGENDTKTTGMKKYKTIPKNPKTNENNKRDSDLSNYDRMASIGIPVQSIVHKMKQDKIPEEKIAIFQKSFDQVSDKPKQIFTPVKDGNRSRIQSNVDSNRKRLQKIHWNPIESEEKIQNSFWANHDDLDTNLELDQKEIDDLESLFGSQNTGNASGYNSKLKKIDNNRMKVKELICLIGDQKRANNIAIALAQYRSFPNYDDLCNAVANQETDRLDAEKLQNMRLLLPTKQETLKVQRYKGNLELLGKAELFFLSVLKISKFSLKLHAFEFSLIFEDQLDELKHSLNLLENACNEVINSSKLSSMLKKLLAVGNLMNESVGVEKVDGITLDSLLQTASKKGSDGKTTVLDYIVKTIMKQKKDSNEGERAMVDFWTDMPNVPECIRLDIQDCNIGILELRQSQKKVELALYEEKKISENCTFIKKSERFIEFVKIQLDDVESKLRLVKDKVRSLCTYFAEDPETAKSSSIFQVLMDFAKLVDTSKNQWNRHEKRRRKQQVEQNYFKKQTKLRFR